MDPRGGLGGPIIDDGSVSPRTAQLLPALRTRCVPIEARHTFSSCVPFAAIVVGISIRCYDMVWYPHDCLIHTCLTEVWHLLIRVMEWRSALCPSGTSRSCLVIGSVRIAMSSMYTHIYRLGIGA